MRGWGKMVELARIELASKIRLGRIHPQAWFTRIQHWGKVNEPFQRGSSLDLKVRREQIEPPASTPVRQTEVTRKKV